MGNVENINDHKHKVNTKDLKQAYYSLHPEELNKITKMKKEGLYKLATELIADAITGNGECIEFKIDDDGTQLIFGAKVLYEFDTEMIVINSLGGGMPFIIEAYELEEEDLYNALKDYFGGMKFVKFVE